MKIIAISLICLLFFCGGCIEHAYYLSSFNANSNPYHTQPLQSDSLKSATYASGVFTVGGANMDMCDYLFAARGSIHRAHTLGNFHLYYGANAAVGEYTLSTNFYPSQNPNTSNEQIRVGKTFGGYGFNGGFNVLIPISNGGEWRVFGMEGSAQNEFGDYFNFRKNYPDSLANLVSRNRWTGTIGITSEIIARRRSGTAIGYKFAIGANLNSYYNYYLPYSLRPMYVSNTLQLTKNHVTVFWQLNFGSYAGNFQFGINYKLGR